LRASVSKNFLGSSISSFGERISASRISWIWLYMPCSRMSSWSSSRTYLYSPVSGF